MTDNKPVKYSIYSVPATLKEIYVPSGMKLDVKYENREPVSFTFRNENVFEEYMGE